MTPGFKAPPKADFDTYASLMEAQATYFTQLFGWAGQECSAADDLNGLLLLPLVQATPKIAALFSEKLAECERGMIGVGSKARATAAAYAAAEHTNETNIAKIYGQSLPGFPDIGHVPGLSNLGDFKDAMVVLKEPNDAGDITALNITEQLTLLGLVSDPAGSALGKKYGLKPGLTTLPGQEPGNLSKKLGIGNVTGQILWLGDSIFKSFTGQSLVQILLYPIVGNYGRLKFLQEAYEQLSEGIYTTTGTMRKGSVRLGGEWEGDAAVAFDSLLFCWSMGSGGLGDAAKIMSDIFQVAYDTLCAMIQIALQLITRFINGALQQLVEAVAGTAAIEVAGGGPEDPVADVVAVAWDVYKVYKIVELCITTATVIVEYFPKIVEAVTKILDDIEVVRQAFAEGKINSQAVINSLLEDVKQRGFEFEKNGGWNPAAGAARIALLPSA